MMMTLAQAHALLPASGSSATPRPRSAASTATRGRCSGRPVRRAARRTLRRPRPHRQARSPPAPPRRSPSAGSSNGLPGLQVADTLAALQQLAAHGGAASPAAGRRGRQQRQDDGDADVRGDPAAPGTASGMLATAGNLNNHIGVPLTLLRLRQDDETWHCAAVVELG